MNDTHTHSHGVPQRDMSIYTRLLDAALESKVQSIVGQFGEIPDGATIIDIGSGTGQVAESIARLYHSQNVHVYAVDLSHELLSIALSNKTFVHLVYADATKLSPIADSSADVTIHGTTGHEIQSKLGPKGLSMALHETYRVLKPGGLEVWRDFLKPSQKGQVLMKIHEQGGTDKLHEAEIDGFLDYSLLSTRKLFDCFYKEFMGGKAFEYVLEQYNGEEYIKLPARFAHEFCLRKDYTANWRQEIVEQYLYWSEEEAISAFESHGFTDVHVTIDDNAYIRQNRLDGKISLFEESAGGLVPVTFPTHMVVRARKPGAQSSNSARAAIQSVDYKALINSIHVDTAAGTVAVGDRHFKIKNSIGVGSHKRGYVLENGRHVIKMVRSDRPNVHNVFKAMQQMIDRQYILEEFGVPHMSIVSADPEGPPYRYVIQEKIPEHSLCAAQIILQKSLQEVDIQQMAAIINAFELSRKWQIDTNPYNWFRVTQPNGTTLMTYVGGTIFAYDEQWCFSRIGLLQWCDPRFIQESEHMTSIIPKSSEADAFALLWKTSQAPPILWWKKYLSQAVQPTT